MRVLGIETSCDETGVAIYDEGQGIIANVLRSQISIHKQYGGVVPELASRDHIKATLPLIKQSLAEADMTTDMLDGIAYTAGPGLGGALLVGAAIGRSLAFALECPAIAVHHMEAHLLAPMLEEQHKPEYPFLALLVSGGHTLLVKAGKEAHYNVLGESVDDAVGEAFDKVAKLLGLGYPGGAALSELAEEGRARKFHFTRPMTSRPGLNFSFSGLKTQVRNTISKADDSKQTHADIAHAFVTAAVDTLTIKCRQAIAKTGIKKLVVAGGVSANKQLRSALQNLAKETGTSVYFPRLAFCTDNGAMIAYTGFLKLRAGQQEPLEFSTYPRWSMDTLS